MMQSLRQQQNISEASLCGEFPFIQGARQEHASPRSAQRSVGNVHTQIPRQQSLVKQTSRFPSEILEDLTKKEIKDVVEILHYSAEAKTGDDVYQVLRLIQQAVACPRVIGGVARLSPAGDFKEFANMLNVSYSNDWVYTYCKNQYSAVDPILKSLLSTFQMQTWEQTYSMASSRKQLEFVEEARSFGLTNGITTGLLEQSRGLATFFSFAGGDAKGTARFRGLIDYLIPNLHRALIKNTPTPLSGQAKGLSSRELTVLLWMKEGKTNWEIARIVGVTERTVRFHVEGIFMKLDANSRTQAVAIAMEHGLFPTE